MSYRILTEADRMARAKFTYKRETRDEWRSFARDVKEGKSWSGDCDDLASTVAHLAIESGFPMNQIWFALVSSKRDKTIDHMIAIAQDQGRFYVIGDTFGPVYPFASMQHNLLYVHRLGSGWDKRRWDRASSSHDL